MDSWFFADDVKPGDDPKEVLLMGRVGAELQRHYPDWEWYVEVPPKQGVVIVRNLTCNPRGQAGFVMHIDKMDALMTCVMRAGGEFLERYRMRRARFTEDQIEGRELIFEKPPV